MAKLFKLLLFSVFVAGYCFIGNIPRFVVLTDDIVSAGKFFFACFAQHTHGFFRLAKKIKMAFQPKAFVAVLRAQGILPRKITFGKTQIMYGIQQVGFALSVAPANAHNAFGKIELLVKVIFELE